MAWILGENSGGDVQSAEGVAQDGVFGRAGERLVQHCGIELARVHVFRRPVGGARAFAGEAHGARQVGGRLRLLGDHDNPIVCKAWVQLSLRSMERKASTAWAHSPFQRMPACLRRAWTTSLQADSTEPLPMGVTGLAVLPVMHAMSIVEEISDAFAHSFWQMHSWIETADIRVSHLRLPSSSPLERRAWDHP